MSRRIALPMTPGLRQLIALRVGSLHVGRSDADVMRDVRAGFGTTWRKYTTASRNRILRTAVKIHHDNRALYRRVMGGGW